MGNNGQLNITTMLTKDNTLAIELRDTGTGIPVENTDIIFEPFFTTKENEGTGLGLAVCKDIIENYNGRIKTKNAPEKGSIFTVYLPLNEIS